MDVNVNEEDKLKVCIEKEKQAFQKYVEEAKKEINDELRHAKQVLGGYAVNQKQRIDDAVNRQLKQVLYDETENKFHDELVSLIDALVENSFMKALGIDFKFKYPGRYIYHPRTEGMDNLQKAIEKAIADVIKNKTDVYKINESIVKEKLKQYEGLDAYQVKMVSFAGKIIDVIKSKLSDSIGDATSAKIVEMLSWEMKARRDRERY